MRVNILVPILCWWWARFLRWPLFDVSWFSFEFIGFRNHILNVLMTKPPPPLQGHIGLSINLNLCRYEFVFPWPQTISYKGLNFYGASLYFAIDRDIERDIGKVGDIIELTREKVLILSINTNSRSKLRHDTYTNQRGKTLEEFIVISDLLLINEALGIPTFETIRRRSWIDLTLCNNILAQNTRKWTCGEEESCVCVCMRVCV